MATSKVFSNLHVSFLVEKTSATKALISLLKKNKEKWIQKLSYTFKSLIFSPEFLF